MTAECRSDKIEWTNYLNAVKIIIKKDRVGKVWERGLGGVGVMQTHLSEDNVLIPNASFLLLKLRSQVVHCILQSMDESRKYNNNSSSKKKRGGSETLSATCKRVLISLNVFM